MDRPMIPSAVPILHSLKDLYSEAEYPAESLRYRKLADRLRTWTHHDSYSNGPQHDAVIWFSCPGRTELGGNHTDHNHGRVLAGSINLDTIAAVLPRQDSLVNIWSEGYKAFSVDLADISMHENEKGSSAALTRGLAAFLSKNAGGAKLRGFSACLDSTVLPGSGLSSSAAFEVLIGSIIAAVNGLAASPTELAIGGQFAENEYFGKPCGLMDQIACALGNICAIDFAQPAAPSIEQLAFDFSAHGYELVVVNSGSSHADLTDEYAGIPAEMKGVANLFGKQTLNEVSEQDILAQAPEIRKKMGDRAFLRALHFAAETQRAAGMKEALERGDLSAYFEMVRESGLSSWRLLQNIVPAGAVRDQNIAVALALTEKFLGREGACRVHGGGFAGTIQVYLPSRRIAEYIDYMKKVFGEAQVFPLQIRSHGVVCLDRI